MTPALLAPQADPATLKARRWGGARLAEWRASGLVDAPIPDEPIGESWEFSTLEGSASRTLDRPLGEVLGHSLPFLAKLIDTALPLSVQVHPADDPVTGASGKEEAWVILEADEGAAIHVGLRDGVDAEHLAARTRAAVADATAGHALLGCLERVEVAAGDTILVPARTPHAIGGGILLAEIQQPADCTYRFFDYGSGRPIHTDEALATTAIDARPLRWSPGGSAGGGATLRGRHVQLAVYDAGQYALPAADYERLLVPALGRTEITHADGRDELGPGELRLLTRDAARLEVDAGGVMVVGWITPGAATTSTPASRAR